MVSRLYFGEFYLLILTSAHVLILQIFLIFSYISSKTILNAGSVQMMQLAGTMKTMTRLYEQAGQTAAEAVENMRTVCSLCIERLFLKKYADCLVEPSRLVKYRSIIIRNQNAVVTSVFG